MRTRLPMLGLLVLCQLSCQKVSNDRSSTSNDGAGESSLTGTVVEAVSNVYRSCLAREPDKAGLDLYVGQINGGKTLDSVTQIICNSSEAYVVKAYRECVQRDPDAGGRASALAHLNGGGNRIAFFQGLCQSAEAKSADVLKRYVASTFQRCLKRAASQGDIDAFYGELAQGATREKVSYEVCTSVEAVRNDVNSIFKSCLNRDPADNEREAWIAEIRADLNGVSRDRLRQAACPPPATAGNTKYGTVIAGPRYNPFGTYDADVMGKGLTDARDLGMQAIKIWMNYEVSYDPQPSYGIPNAYFTPFVGVNASTDPMALAKMAQTDFYQRIWNSNFQTIVIVTDTLDAANSSIILNKKSTDTPARNQAFLNDVSTQHHNLVTYLANAFPNKTFIIQRNEIDWWALPDCVRGGTCGFSALSEIMNGFATEPDYIGYARASDRVKDYMNARHRGIVAARNAVAASGKPMPKIYSLCEMTHLLASNRGEAGWLVDKLSAQDCDYMGYSSYESFLTPAPAGKPQTTFASENMNASVDHLMRRLGSDASRILISEIGLGERVATTGQPDALKAAFDLAVNKGVAYILQWELYDNECADRNDTKCVRYWANTDASHLRGLWVRRPDATIGDYFASFQAKYFYPSEGSKVEYVKHLYRRYLGREIDAGALANVQASVHTGANVAGFENSLVKSAEFQARHVVAAYRACLQRDPEPWSQESAAAYFAAGNSIAAFSDLLCGTAEGQQAEVYRLYRKYFNRDPDAGALTSSLSSLKSGGLPARVDLEGWLIKSKRKAGAEELARGVCAACAPGMCARHYPF